MGLTRKLWAMWMILGTIAPTSLHVAQILHTIRHSLNAGTYCHTRRHSGRGPLHPAPPSRELPPLRSAFLALTWCSAGVAGWCPHWLLHYQRDRDADPDILTTPCP